MSFFRKALGAAVIAVLMCTGQAALAKTILYVPQDNRPVDFAYTVSTAEDAGYTVITPPSRYLSGSNFQGSPTQLMEWVELMPWSFLLIPSYTAVSSIRVSTI